MNNKELLAKWQKRLGLSDWIIDLRDNVTSDEMTLQGVSGECEWQEVKKTAIIRIMKPECYGERITTFNFEQTLIHELLHIKFCLLDESGNPIQDRVLHQIIEDLAKAFVVTEMENKNDKI